MMRLSTISSRSCSSLATMNYAASARGKCSTAEHSLSVRESSESMHASRALSAKSDPAHAITRYALLVSNNASRARKISSVLNVGGLNAEVVEEPAALGKTIAARQERPSIFCTVDQLDDVLAACRDHAALDVFA